MLSTYINSLARNDFIVEELIEETDKEKEMA
jgi:glucan phosphoethanolaminetransferase (alkaline phosphatase superfamily)